jgi:hypothetical protein
VAGSGEPGRAHNERLVPLARREVTETEKDRKGDLCGLCDRLPVRISKPKVIEVRAVLTSGPGRALTWTGQGKLPDCPRYCPVWAVVNL